MGPPPTTNLFPFMVAILAPNAYVLPLPCSPQQPSTGGWAAPCLGEAMAVNPLGGTVLQSSGECVRL